MIWRNRIQRQKLCWQVSGISSAVLGPRPMCNMQVIRKRYDVLASRNYSNIWVGIITKVCLLLTPATCFLHTHYLRHIFYKIVSLTGTGCWLFIFLVVHRLHASKNVRTWWCVMVLTIFVPGIAILRHSPQYHSIAEVQSGGLQIWSRIHLWKPKTTNQGVPWTLLVPIKTRRLKRKTPIAVWSCVGTASHKAFLSQSMPYSSSQQSDVHDQ